jgi:hypothetical protein
MALLKFDPRSFTVSVQVGILETYKPDKEIKAIVKKLDRVKSLAEKKLNSLVKGEMTPQERMSKLQEDSKAEAKWKTYVNDKFMPEIKDLIDRINLKNEQICPGFKSKPE